MKFRVTAKNQKYAPQAKVLTRVLNAELKDPTSGLLKCIEAAIQSEFEDAMMADIVGRGWVKVGKKGRQK